MRRMAGADWPNVFAKSGNHDLADLRVLQQCCCGTQTNSGRTRYTVHQPPGKQNEAAAVRRKREALKTQQ